MTLRIAILGAGRIGKVHARAVASVPGAALVAVAEPMAEAAKQIRAEFDCDIREIDQIAASDDVDAVVICTPTDTHANLIEQFTAAGKAVFCEKPIDLNVARVRTCLKNVEATGGRLMLGFNRRFDPDFMALRAAIDDGRIGKVEMITLTSRDPGPPPYDYITRSGGIFRDMMIHDFDVARWLLGEEVTSVQAAASVLTDPEIGRLGDYDSVNVILTTDSGKQCTITNTRRAAYGYDQRIEVHGSNGSVSARNTHEANIEIADASGYHRPPLLNFFMTRYVTAYANEIAAFVQALESGSDMPTTGLDGLKALELAEAALKSVETGAAVQPG
ncbi:inositol 2-dehydrogenase [Yoonia sediminilitoris]|uniref:Myo-inositol 2-dehydrogenase n=1 Tax=Yoonia sediminilitoris TaxID=1286148 RepID=A0A2T6KG39_9RHOB|nr:inositol 2-dehydrogenase [Yoonia sediminilitoris]PUB14283.1 myo-inositol 2-dehydrogenase [Yoonia sediminilitoris]RCW95214.1 myo-inositol 2-dehydrogenase [Yoonia sediminilitoris]